MARDFHGDPKMKWDHQFLVTQNYIIPFIKSHVELQPDAKVLEVGCGEGGVLKAFVDGDYLCYGVDIAAHRIENANKFLAREVAEGKVSFYAADVHDTECFQHLSGQIDLLILKDAIEHIHDQQEILQVLHRFVKPGGIAFVAFPPWYNPFGGHQQLANSFLQYTPWFHILPRALYAKLLALAGENEKKIHGLLEIHDTKLPIFKFQRILEQTHWQIVKRQFYLFNPIYEYKFGLRGRKQFRLVAALPLVRDFLSTGVYYLLKPSV